MPKDICHLTKRHKLRLIQAEAEQLERDISAPARTASEGSFHADVPLLSDFSSKLITDVPLHSLDEDDNYYNVEIPMDHVDEHNVQFAQQECIGDIYNEFDSDIVNSDLSDEDYENSSYESDHKDINMNLSSDLRDIVVEGHLSHRLTNTQRINITFITTWSGKLLSLWFANKHSNFY